MFYKHFVDIKTLISGNTFKFYSHCLISESPIFISKLIFLYQNFYFLIPQNALEFYFACTKQSHL